MEESSCASNGHSSPCRQTKPGGTQQGHPESFTQAAQTSQEGGMKRDPVPSGSKVEGSFSGYLVRRERYIRAAKLPSQPTGH